MSSFERYTFTLCIVTFVVLTASFALLLTRDVKSTLKMIKGGLLDREIREKRQKKEAKQKNKAVRIIFDYCLPSIVLVVLVTLFVFSTVTACDEKKYVGDIPKTKVVESGSMSYKYEENEYLFKNKLDDQIGRFDLVFVEKLPPESDLKLYDIVVYEYEGNLIIHRIVNIDEPDESQGEKRFVLQGDANRYSDGKPVSYSQMRGIYRGKKIPYIGSFVSFMRSPSGYLCLFLVAAVLIVYPLLEKYIEKEENKRLKILDSESVTQNSDDIKLQENDGNITKDNGENTTQ